MIFCIDTLLILTGGVSSSTLTVISVPCEKETTENCIIENCIWTLQIEVNIIIHFTSDHSLGSECRLSLVTGQNIANNWPFCDKIGHF